MSLKKFHGDLEVSMKRLQTQTKNGAKFETWRISVMVPALQRKLAMISDATSEDAENECPTKRNNVFQNSDGGSLFSKIPQEMRKQTNASREEQ